MWVQFTKEKNNNYVTYCIDNDWYICIKIILFSQGYLIRRRFPSRWGSSESQSKTQQNNLSACIYLNCAMRDCVSQIVIWPAWSWPLDTIHSENIDIIKMWHYYEGGKKVTELFISTTRPHMQLKTKDP